MEKSDEKNYTYCRNVPIWLHFFHSKQFRFNRYEK